MLSHLIFDSAVLGAFAYLLIYPIIRYFYDPKGLRKYPNYAFLSGITDLRHFYLAAQGFWSKDLHEERKRRDSNYVFFSGAHRHLFDVVDKAEHFGKRRLLSATFAIKNLENREYKVKYTAERLFKALDKKCTEPPKGSVPDAADVNLDFNHWIKLWATEAINYICVSAEMDLLDTSTDEVTAERRDGSLYRGRYRHAQNQTSYVQSIFVWDYAHWPCIEWLSKTIWQEAKPWDDIYYHQAAQRLRPYQAGEELEGFFSCLLEDKTGNPNNLEWGEIFSETGAIINAGADTTAIALTHILELLLKHPEHLQWLREEVDDVLEEDEVIARYDKVKNLPFLRACLDEGLRIIPLTSAGLPRRTPAEGAQILDEWIAGDTSVNMTIYAAHRDASILPDPENFDPNRWLGVDARKRMELAFSPFSTSGRGCIGRNISYLEQVIVLASLVHRYEFALAGPDFERERFEAFNIICGPLPPKIWKREMK